MQEMPHCSIAIRAYNEEKHIGRLLTGILRQTVQQVEIVLVDSGSIDATVAIASRYPVKIIHIQPEEFTFGRSLNRGLQDAKGEFVIITSAHVYPMYPDWIEELLRPFNDPKVALVYGKQRGNAKTKYSEHQYFAKMYPDESIPQQKHPFCNNANAAIRRSLWLQYPYNEDLTGLEDLDWGSWAIEQGYYLAYSATAEVIHVHDETPRQVYNRYRREAIALKNIRPQEHFHLWDFVWLYLTNVTSDCWHAVREHAFLREFLGILSFRFLQFWGTYRGFALSGPLTRQLREVFYYPRGIRSSRSITKRDISPIHYPRVYEHDFISPGERGDQNVRSDS
jgi:rhamnosyltransferase